ncbi:MAG: Lrp/AsnC family transcriptional regulator [Candidatus Nanohaloarchaea archaeon]
MKIDDTDLKILEELREDGRRSLRQIAENLDLSPSTASNRFKKMKEEGVIKGFFPEIDHEAIGFSFTTITHIRAASGGIDTIKEELSDRGFVSSYYTVTGDTDIIAICGFLNREKMNRHLQDLQSLEGIEDIRTNVVLEAEGMRGSLDFSPIKEEID